MLPATDDMRGGGRAKCDVVIVNWNSGPLLARCLDSLDRHGGPHVASVSVIDNGSTDGSDLSAEDRPGVTLVPLQQNLGFAEGCNRGADLGEAELLLFLNPDAELGETTLAPMIAAMLDPAGSTIGICGPRLVGVDGHTQRSCARLPTARSIVMHALGITRLFPAQGYQMAEWSHDETTRVAHVIGACYLIRRSLFQQLHGFDRSYFVYLEDLDLSHRVLNAGYSCLFVAEAQAFHKGGGSSEKVVDLRLFYALRSRLIYARKWFSRFGRIAVAASTLFIEPVVRLALHAARFDLSQIRSTVRAYELLFGWLFTSRSAATPSKGDVRKPAP